MDFISCIWREVCAQEFSAGGGAKLLYASLTRYQVLISF